jgi:hypothetical protein
MEIIIMAITVDLRTNNAPKVQEVLTKHGCIIKMRLGLHETSSKMCSERGLILLQLCGEDDEVKALKEDLVSVQGVKLNTMTI